MSVYAEVLNLVRQGWVVIAFVDHKEITVETKHAFRTVPHDNVIHLTDIKTVGFFKLISMKTLHAVVKDTKRLPVERPVGYGRGKSAPRVA